MCFSIRQRLNPVTKPLFSGLPEFLSFMLNAIRNCRVMLDSPERKRTLRPSSRLIFLPRRSRFNFRAPLLFLALLAASGSTEAALNFAAGTGYQNATHSGQFPYTVATGLFNADAFRDLAVVYNTGSVVAIFSNNSGSPGTFTTGGGDNYGVWNANYNNPYSTTVADFDGDGKLDVAFTERVGVGSYKIGVLRGNGDGTFQPATYFTVGGAPAGNGPTGIVSGDFNGDGKPDLAVTMQNSNQVSVLVNNGSSGTVSFLASVEYTTAVFPSAIGAADFDSDGKLDLVVQCAPGGAGTGIISIFRGNGDGTFQAKDDYAAGTANATSLAVGDFNGDGNIDVATVDHVGAAKVQISQHTGNSGVGLMFPTTQGGLAGYTTGSSPYGVAAADLDGDGKIDLAVANNNSASYSVLVNNGAGVFLPKVDFNVHLQPYGIAAVDLNNDGKIDIITVGRGGTVTAGDPSGMWDPTFMRLNSSTTAAPNAPTIGTATGSNGQASVAFTASYPNGSAVTSFTVTSSPGGITASASASPITVTGLSNGTAYTFSVTATNGIGTSVASGASNSVTPTTTVPDAPTGVSATTDNAQASVSFSAPANDGGSAIDSYTATCGGFTASGSASPLTVTGLTNGTSYTCTVTAHNATGNSVASAASASFTPAFPQPTASTEPASGISSTGATFNGTVTANGASTTVSFQYDLPMMDRQPLWSAVASQSPLAANAVNATVSASISGLTCNTTYQYRVSAVNSSGTTPGIYSTFTTSACTAAASGGDYTPPLPPPTQTPNGNSTPVGSTGAVVTNPDSHVTLDGNGALVIDTPPATPYVISRYAPDNSLILLPPNQPVGITTDGVTLTYIDKSGKSQLMVRNLDGHPKLEVGYGNVEIRSNKAGNTIPVISDSKHKLVAVIVTTGDGDGITIVRKDSQAGVFVENGKVEYQGTGQDQPIPIFEGENGKVDASGKLTQLALGSSDGSKQVPGDPLPILEGLAPGTLVPNLYGKLLRFEKKISLLDIIKQAFQEVLGNVEGELYYDKSTGVITYLVGTTGYRVIPLGNVIVLLNQLSAASVSATATGSFSLASQGVQMTLSSAVGYFSDLQQALKAIDAGAKVMLKPNGVLELNTGGNRFAAIPGMAASLPENPIPVPGFETDANGLMVFRDHLGATQPLFPAFYDIDRLNAVVQLTLQLQGSSSSINGNGTVTLSKPGQSYTLIPDYAILATPGNHLSELWWTEGERFFLQNTDSTAQGFKVY